MWPGLWRSDCRDTFPGRPDHPPMREINTTFIKEGFKMGLF